LVRKADFEVVYRGGGRLKSPQFVVFYGANGRSRSRFGISVKKALGNAVVRNRIRRRIREILRRNGSEIPWGWDIVMHPRRSVARANFAALEAELVGLLRGLPRPAEATGTQTPRPAGPSEEMHKPH
jgi:ribonuclease P protein component